MKNDGCRGSAPAAPGRLARRRAGGGGAAAAVATARVVRVYVRRQAVMSCRYVHQSGWNGIVNKTL